MKALSEMSQEELWRLFPLSLVKQSERCAAHDAEMEELLRSILTDFPSIGSAISGAPRLKAYGQRILIGCTEEEKAIVDRTYHETPFVRGILIRR